MLRLLWDWPNAITATGLAVAVLALNAARHDRFLSVLLLLWAVMCDHLDGTVAKKLKARHPGAAKIGGDLDSFADMVTGGVVPAFLVLSYGRPHVFALVAAALLVVCAGLRLAYFNNFGLTDAGRFHGMPMTYNAPLLSLLLVATSMASPNAQALSWCIAATLMAALHVSDVRPRPIRGVGVLYYLVFAVVASVLLLYVRSISIMQGQPA
ncbi:CDP-alcohol phosphatidyltransferase family protein [Verminephrobacter aporrectodeae]|uniref:CDP-alcohol phosphatidyltransferase family protein n=1 Tax=Verminephrobacter aporrectodeae TaxID=1110389 RepID=UPI0004974B49|nr:CDP-alcohol phosphatidyltransferase family protein [Verminephrobacter aporrectodeae]